MAQRDPIAEREKFVEGWNNTMVDIWRERIQLLNVIDTRALIGSVRELPVRADGRFYDITLSQTFLEYGIWQNFGVGRELRHGDYEHNADYIETHGRKREKRPWLSVKYYSSVMKLRDFMAQSLGDEFKSMFCEALDEKRLRSKSKYYRKKGYV